MHNVILTSIFILHTALFTSLCAMEQEQSQELKRARTEALKESNEGLKRSKSSHKEILLRQIARIGWKNALIEGTNIETLTPYEFFEAVELEVEPIVKAVYEDDVERIKELCLSPSTDLLCTTQGIVDSREHATILDIAADRKAFSCLSLFKKIVGLEKPKQSLEKIICYEITKLSLTKTAQEQCGHIVDVLARAQSGELAYLYQKIHHILSILYDKARQSAYSIAKQSGDIELADLLLPIKNK